MTLSTTLWKSDKHYRVKNPCYSGDSEDSVKSVKCDFNMISTLNVNNPTWMFM